jgi:GT2 family glycosyltransferase
VVLNFNGAATIERCIESILSQSLSPYEIILVDNNSTDGSSEQAQRRFPELHLVQNYRNLGFSGGNNAGIKRSSGDLVLLANNDAILNRDAISSLVDALSGNVGIVSGVLLNGSGRKIWSYGGYFDQLSGMHWHGLQGASSLFSVPLEPSADYAPGALLLARRALLDKVGLLDPYFFLYGDDIDLALKAARLGRTVKLVPKPIAIHLVSQTVRKFEQKHELLGYYMMNRSMFYLYFSQLPLPFAITSTVTQLGFSFFELLLFRRPFSYLRAKMTALAHSIGDLGKARMARSVAQGLGPLPVRLRLKELISLVRSRSIDRVYYW